MRVLVLMCVSFFIVNQALAGEICTQVPDAITFDKVYANYDGSFTYENPKLFVNGKMMSVAKYDGYGGDRGLCYLVGKNFVSTLKEITPPKDEEIAVIGNAGSLRYVQQNLEIVTQYICK